ncbi:hypothetical protein [Rhizobium sp. BT03]|uniref:hypothetical protein n=1 Tax=Rhizobium sp. BT03 TaxID=3045156 RepID=UPI0024B3CE31|nr:hypothetical protein [Rhizobium sp. BT03]WHO74478.1 hypothetical protein QMO80_003553 [Rhizobium sp. BT03]
MKMKKCEHARGDCIEDAGFFAFADRSRDISSSAARNGSARSQSLRASTFIGCRLSPESGSSAAGRKAFGSFRPAIFLSCSRLLTAMKRTIGPIFGEGRLRAAAPKQPPLHPAFSDAYAEEFFVCALARR